MEAGKGQEVAEGWEDVLSRARKIEGERLQRGGRPQERVEASKKKKRLQRGGRPG